MEDHDLDRVPGSCGCCSVASPTQPDAILPLSCNAITAARLEVRLLDGSQVAEAHDYKWGGEEGKWASIYWTPPECQPLYIQFHEVLTIIPQRSCYSSYTAVETEVQGRLITSLRSQSW